MTNKKRPIDANAMREDWLENGENEYVYDANAVIDSIDEQPTMDAVEVVRCKDCIMYEEHINERTRFCRLNLGHSYADPNGFCSYGERREQK